MTTTLSLGTCSFCGSSETGIGNDDTGCFFACASCGRSKPMTITIAKNIARALGCTIKYSHDWEEYRVNFVGGREATAAYTDDLDDAVGTMQAMAEHRNAHKGA